MKLNIFVKVTAMVLAAVLITSVALFTVSIYFVRDGFDSEAKANIKIFQTVVDKRIQSHKGELLNAATAMSFNSRIAEDLQKGETGALRALLKKQLATFSAETAFVTDAKGSSWRAATLKRRATARRAVSAWPRPCRASPPQAWSAASSSSSSSWPPIR